jgi:hypothetical protein
MPNGILRRAGHGCAKAIAHLQPPRYVVWGGSWAAAAYHNQNINAVIKAMCNKLRQRDPNVTMAGLLQNSPVKLGQVVLVDGNCIDFHAFGVCQRGASCKFHHDATARPCPDQVAQFMDLVKPLAKGFAWRRPAKRARAGGGGPG